MSFRALVLVAAAGHAAAALAAPASSLVTPAALAAVSPATLTVELLSAVSAQALAELYSTYDAATGWFGPKKSIPYWTTANAVEAIVNIMNLTGDTSPMPYIENTFAKFDVGFSSTFNDDHGWYVLAWARAAEVTGNATYLDKAVQIHHNLTGVWNAWNATCGGLNWNATGGYVNSITNELFLSSSVKLYELTGDAAFLTWANREWAFFNATPLLSASPFLYQDGLSSKSCGVASGAYWTYNSGVALSGIVRLGALTAQPRLPSFAAQVAAAAADYFRDGAANGVIRERSCSATGDCGGQDGKQFKGSWVRHLGYAYAAAAAASPDPAGTLRYFEDVILNNTASLLSAGSRTPGRSGGTSVSFSQLWQGPWQANECCPYVTQVSGLDLVGASLVVLRRRAAAAAAAVAT